AWIVVAPFYYAGFESSRHQATLGKQAIGIQVTDLEGRRLSLGRALGRWFAASLSYLTLYIGFFMAGFTQRKQALHDYVAGTLVVDRWAFSEQPERQQRTLGAGVIVLAIAVPLVCVALLGIVAAIALPAYQDYTLRAKVAEAMVQGSALKVVVAEAVAESERCPQNGEAGIEAATSYANGIVAGITAAPRADGRCGLDIALTAPQQPQLDQHVIQLSFDRASGQWDCRTDMAPRFTGTYCVAQGPTIAR
ncbi:MAG TPA: RDD family protein, partial [Dokdonella sp.]